MARLFTDELSLAVSVCFTIQTWHIAYLDQTCLWLFTNEDQINCVFIVHMVPIEELPSTRTGIVMGLSSPLDSNVSCLDNNKLDFQIKSRAWYDFSEQRLSFSLQLSF